VDLAPHRLFPPRAQCEERTRTDQSQPLDGAVARRRVVCNRRRYSDGRGRLRWACELLRRGRPQGGLVDFVAEDIRFPGPQANPDTPNYFGNRHYRTTETVHPGDGSSLDDGVWEMQLIVATLSPITTAGRRGGTSGTSITPAGRSTNGLLRVRPTRLLCCRTWFAPDWTSPYPSRRRRSATRRHR